MLCSCRFVGAPQRPERQDHRPHSVKKKQKKKQIDPIARNSTTKGVRSLERLFNLHQEKKGLTTTKNNFAKHDSEAQYDAIQARWLDGPRTPRAEPPKSILMQTAGLSGFRIWSNRRVFRRISVMKPNELPSTSQTAPAKPLNLTRIRSR